MMAGYDDFGMRQSGRFAMFASAVAGERALARAAGMAPGSIQQWQRSDSFRQGLLGDLRADAARYLEEHLGNAQMETMRERGQVRMQQLIVHVSSLASQVVRQSNKVLLLERSPAAMLDPTRPAGAIGVLAQRKLAAPEFRVRDGAGRMWDGAQLVETISRDFAYQVFIDHQFDVAIAQGQPTVSLMHPDSDHKLQGHIIDLAGEWFSERDQVFHINSRLVLDDGAVPA